MTRPAASCLCVGKGMWAAIYANGPDKQQRVEEFLAAHDGPDHLKEIPPRDWHGKEAALARRLREMRRL
jgi:hypothetical protein